MFEDFLVMPENCRWTVVNNVSSHESAYSSQCYWFFPDKRIAVMNIRTGETKIFIREADRNGNLKKIIELNKDGTYI